VAKSKYEEDVFINDHTSVWGSWFNKYLGWGYGCCHSNEKMSFCIGIKGRERALARELKMKALEVKELQKLKELEEQEENN
jgi:pre-mRNA-processing factor SLU7